MKLGFKVGEKLVYPNHGVTVVEQIGESPIMDAGESYYHLRLLATNSRLMVPIRNTDRAEIREARNLLRQQNITVRRELLDERKLDKAAEDALQLLLKKGRVEMKG